MRLLYCGGMIDQETLLSSRAARIDASGIRRAFQLGAKLDNPINLSIGQPHFPVPDPLKDAAIKAIRDDANGYTLTSGHPTLQASLRTSIAEDLGWPRRRRDRRDGHVGNQWGPDPGRLGSA